MPPARFERATPGLGRKRAPSLHVIPVHTTAENRRFGSPASSSTSGSKAHRGHRVDTLRVELLCVENAPAICDGTKFIRARFLRSAPNPPNNPVPIRRRLLGSGVVVTMLPLMSKPG